MPFAPPNVGSDRPAAPLDGSRVPPPAERRVEWLRSTPFITMHLACLGVFLVGWRWTALAVAAGLYAFRMFAITGFYHRYFSHRSFRTSRACQFLFAVAGNSAVQKGPLWWAAHHRFHHRHSDEEVDLHSPFWQGFWWSHMGWFTCKVNAETNLKAVPDLARYPELRFLDKFHGIVPLALAGSLYALGVSLHRTNPALGTSGPQMLVWGFFISTVVCYHATYTINSLAHKWGSRRYETGDDSRNNFFLAVLTLGEGWHNNHHHYPGSTRQGFYWWEVDLTWYALKAMSWMGLVWDLRSPPVHIRDRTGRRGAGTA